MLQPPETASPKTTSPEAAQSTPVTTPVPAEQAQGSPPIDGHGLFKSLMLRLPRSVRRSLDHEQIMALRQAAEETAWGEHPIDIRLTLPFPGTRRYLVLVGGTERRDPQRRRQERLRHPLVRVGNIASFFVFLLILAGVGGLIGMILLAILLA